jgi:MFS transporter
MRLDIGHIVRRGRHSPLPGCGRPPGRLRCSAGGRNPGVARPQSPAGSVLSLGVAVGETPGERGNAGSHTLAAGTHGCSSTTGAAGIITPGMPRPPAGRPAARPGAALVAASLALFLVDLDFFALNLAVPAIAQNLRVSVTDLQWVISGYMLALGAFLIPGGRLGDILGRRRTLIAGVALFSGASTVCGVVDSADVVIGFRLVQGIGAAIIFPICVAVVTNAFPEERRKRAIGNLYGLAAVAVAVRPSSAASSPRP